MNVRFHLTYNGQSLEFELMKDGGTNQVTGYYQHGERVPLTGFAGYKSGRFHVAATRTLANMAERFVTTNYPNA